MRTCNRNGCMFMERGEKMEEVMTDKQYESIVIRKKTVRIQIGL